MFCQDPKNSERKSESGMSLLAILGMMAIFAIALLAVAPTVQIEVQREKELEAIRRGEEVANAIRQFVNFYQGRKLPTSMQDLLEGLPQGTKKRMILRPSAAVDPLSEDGEWRLVTPQSKAFLNFGKRVQIYNNGVLPSSPPPTQYWDQFSIIFVNIANTEDESEIVDSDETELDDVANSPFIGVVSKSRSKSVISYYGLENHSKWVFTPIFRGTGMTNSIPRPNANSNMSNPRRSSRFDPPPPSAPPPVMEP